MSQNSRAEDTRLSVLDGVLDGQQDVALASDLFAVVDLLESQPAVRRALTDPGRAVQFRQQLATNLLQGRVSEAALAVVRAATEHRWASGSTFVAALERQGVRAELRGSVDEGELDEIEDELFRFGRLVASDQELRRAVSDRSRSLPGRQELVARLLVGKVRPATAALAVRAVKGREHNFDRTLDGYLELAAETRQRSVATVRVARPLDEHQAARLRAALSRQTGRDVAMHVVVDPEVLGGIRVELGDELIEGTVAARLEDARRKLQ